MWSRFAFLLNTLCYLLKSFEIIVGVVLCAIHGGWVLWNCLVCYLVKLPTVLMAQEALE